MKMVDAKSGIQEPPVGVRVNRTGRRTYSLEYKREVVQECSAPGASVAGIALSHGLNANLVRRWIVQHRNGQLVAPTMLPVRLPTQRALSVASDSRASGLIEIELKNAVIRVRGTVDAGALKSALEALAKG